MDVARRTFGHNEMRPGQLEAISAVVDGRDTLAVMPTGSGKSAVYQIAGMLIEGVTIVVSPLIALQRDQVAAITEIDAGGAAEVNSALSSSARQRAFADLTGSELEFLFLAPEQFGNEETMAALRETPPSLFVIDEAHCVSEWGHDFRPDFLRLGTVIEELGRPVTLALTATAAPPVRAEIIERLGMREPATIVRGFDRPNIRLSVETFRAEDEKRAALLDEVEAARKPGIVYAATRRETEEIAALVMQRGVCAAAYHAGLKASEREELERGFGADEYEVIVATIAFGMGIDKPNVRFVFHHDVSASIDAYYQEIGRAGRDGEPAEARLFYLAGDLGLRRFQAGMGVLEAAQVERLAETVLEHDEPVDPAELRDEAELTDTTLTRALARLEEAGAVELLPDGDVMATAADIDPVEVATEAVSAQDNLRKFAQSRIEMVRHYAELHDCRRAFLLNYFGEPYEGPCGLCDNCEAGVTTPNGHSSEPFPLNSRVEHAKWGAGQVIRYKPGMVIVLFDSVGYRTHGIDLVIGGDLLRPA